MGSSFDDPAAAERHQTQIVNRRQPRHLPPRLDRGHQAPHSLAAARRAARSLRRRHLGGVRPRRLDAVPPDLAAEQPNAAHKLQRLWLIEAMQHGVLPMDDRGLERVCRVSRGSPARASSAGTPRCCPGMGHLNESSVITIKNRSHAVTAQVAVPDAGAEGVVCPGGIRAAGACTAATSRLVAATTWSACSTSTSTQTSGCRPATRCGWSSTTTAPASPRAAPSPSPRRHRRRQRAAPANPGRGVLQADEATHVGRRLGLAGHARTTRPAAQASPARSGGCRSTWTTPPPARHT